MSTACSSPLSTPSPPGQSLAVKQETLNASISAAGPTRSVVELGSDLLATVLDLKDDDGCQTAHAFLELPDRKLYPSYYEHISHPLSLNEISAKHTSSDPYKSLEEMQKALNRVFWNAQKYNAKDSIIFAAARELKRELKTKYDILHAEMTASNPIPAAPRASKRRESDLPTGSHSSDRGSSRPLPPPASPNNKRHKGGSVPVAPKPPKGMNGYAYVLEYDVAGELPIQQPIESRSDRMARKMVETERELAETKKQLAEAKKQSDKRDATFAKTQEDPSVTLLWPEERSRMNEQMRRYTQKALDDGMKHRETEADLRTQLESANTRIKKMGAENTSLQLELSASKQEAKILQEQNTSLQADLRSARVDVELFREEIKQQGAAHAGQIASLKSQHEQSLTQLPTATPTPTPTPTASLDTPTLSLPTDPDIKPSLLALLALDNQLEPMLNAYEPLAWMLQTLKGKDEREAGIVSEMRALLPEFTTLNDLMMAKKRR